jgi:hypothetical protein
MRILQLALIAVSLSVAAACNSSERAAARQFDSADAAAKALIETAASGTPAEIRAFFGSDADDLILSSDPVTARRNREVFAIATRESWRLGDDGPDRKTLIIGHEQWPFPIPIVKTDNRWSFDTEAGREEVLARRIGRNELAVMQISKAYVVAQRAYALRGRDGQPAGRYATAFMSDPGKQNGLYWPAKAGQPRSPLSDLVARAAQEGRALDNKTKRAAPLRGYYFRILPSAGGFAMVAWPAEYDITGVMTFQINQSGVLFEKDLGPATADEVKKIASYGPDATWSKAQ